MQRLFLFGLTAYLVALVGCSDPHPTPTAPTPLSTAPTSPPSVPAPITAGTSLFQFAGIYRGVEDEADGIGPVVLPDADGGYTLATGSGYTFQLNFTRPSAGYCVTTQVTFSWNPASSSPGPCSSAISIWIGFLTPEARTDAVQGEQQITIVAKEQGTDSSAGRITKVELAIRFHD